MRRDTGTRRARRRDAWYRRSAWIRLHFFAKHSRRSRRKWWRLEDIDELWEGGEP